MNNTKLWCNSGFYFTRLSWLFFYKSTKSGISNSGCSGDNKDLALGHHLHRAAGEPFNYLQLDKTKLNSKSRIIPGVWLCAAEFPRTPWLFTPYPTAFAVALVYPSEGTGQMEPGSACSPGCVRQGCREVSGWSGNPLNALWELHRHYSGAPSTIQEPALLSQGTRAPTVLSGQLLMAERLPLHLPLPSSEKKKKFWEYV